jgi:hypothetical protein
MVKQYSLVDRYWHVGGGATAVLYSVDGEKTFSRKAGDDVPSCTASHSRTAVIIRTYQIHDRLNLDLPRCRLLSM